MQEWLVMIPKSPCERCGRHTECVLPKWPEVPQGIGFVYVAGNPDFSEVKIGFTTRLVELHIKEYQTYAPKPYGILYRKLSARAELVEKRAHKILADRRTNGEWFETTIDGAKLAINQAISEIEGIAAWRQRSPIKLQFDPRLTEQPTQFLSMTEGDRLFILRQQSLMGRSEPHDIWYAHSTGDQIEFKVAANRECVFGMSTPDERTVIDTTGFVDESEQIHNLALNGREFLQPGDRLVWISRLATGQVHYAIFDTWNYLQVTSRTVEPKFSSMGPGLIMTVPPDHEPEDPPEVGQFLRAAVKGHRPRVLPEDTPLFP